MFETGRLTLKVSSIPLLVLVVPNLNWQYCSEPLEPGWKLMLYQSFPCGEVDELLSLVSAGCPMVSSWIEVTVSEDGECGATVREP